MSDSNGREDRIGEYVKNIKEQAEELVMVKFPQMAMELDELLKTSSFNISDKISEHNGQKKFVPDSDSWNCDIDGFISKMTQKLSVSSNLLPSFSDPAQFNKNTANAENFKISDVLPVDSIAHIQCRASDSCNSGHKEFEMPIPESDSLNRGSESVSKGQNLSLTDRLQCKKHIVDIIQLMKAIFSRLLEDIQFLKMWIQFLTPRKEDADSLIEGVLNDILQKIEKVESKVSDIFRRVSRYFYYRSFMIKKYLKHPQVNDYENALQEHDEEYYCEIRYSLSEIRNFYAILHDMISKNVKELKKSRAFNPSMMY